MTDRYLPLSEVFKILAHPGRLRILEVLANGEASVSRLATLVEKRQAYVSQQLMILREAGLVRDRREGSTVIYSLSSMRIMSLTREAQAFLASIPVEGLAPQVPAESSAPPVSCFSSIWTPEED